MFIRNIHTYTYTRRYVYRYVACIDRLMRIDTRSVYILVWIRTTVCSQTSAAVANSSAPDPNNLGYPRLNDFCFFLLLLLSPRESERNYHRPSVRDFNYHFLYTYMNFFFLFFFSLTTTAGISHPQTEYSPDEFVIVFI